MTFLMDGGFFMWGILALAVAIAVLAVRTARRLRRMSGPDPLLETGIDATLFWGAWAVLLGILGTLIGIYRAAGVILAGTTATPAAVWGVVRVSLTTTLAGVTIFAAAALVWFVLRASYRRRVVTI